MYACMYMYIIFVIFLVAGFVGELLGRWCVQNKLDPSDLKRYEYSSSTKDVPTGMVYILSYKKNNWVRQLIKPSILWDVISDNFRNW